MSALRECRRVLLRLGTALLVAACGGGDDDGVSSPAGNRLLFDLNATENEGRTVRWDPVPISVYLGDVGTESEVTEWTTASGGKVTFTFVASAPASGVSFRKASLDADVCGIASIEFQNDQLVAADIRVNQDIYRSRDCVRTVTHEAGHAVGIFNHTADGGLMDLDGGSGEITQGVADMVRDLYSLAPGTTVSVAEGRVGARRPGARHTVTIVDRTRP